MSQEDAIPIKTRSSAVVKRPRDASYLSLASLQYVDRKLCFRFQSINQRNFYSAPYKTWTAALDNVNI